MELQTSHACFGGVQQRYSHPAVSLGGWMNLSIFLPPGFDSNSPVLLLLAGRGGDDLSWSEKSGAQRLAAELGLVLVMPDTSLRGEGVANAAEINLGQGASYYFDAQVDPWRAHYQMETYLCRELPPLLAGMGLGQRLGICGFSMGGHGALMLALKHPQLFSSVSALAPVCTLVASERGRQILTTYLGDDQRLWQQADSSLLLANRGWHGASILVDVGADDELLAYLDPESLVRAAAQSSSRLELKLRPGYDHSYYFVASFIAAHLDHHASVLRAAGSA